MAYTINLDSILGEDSLDLGFFADSLLQTSRGLLQLCLIAVTEVICQSHLFHYTYIAFPVSERISSSLILQKGVAFWQSVHVFIVLNMYTTMKLVITSVIFFRLVLLHGIQFS